jgi:predicted TIM-barrel fold metal-dependent hydrolase
MIIDFHTHVGTIVKKNIADLLNSMILAQIDKSVVIAGKYVVGLDNEELIDLLEKHPDKLYGILDGNLWDIKKNIKTYGSLASSSFLTNFEKMLKHPNVLGIKLYCGYEHFYPYEMPKDFLKLLSEQNKIVMVHCGDTLCTHKDAKLKYAMPIHIDELATDNPELKIVIAHMGFPFERETSAVMYKNKNVFTDISGFVYGNFKKEDETKFIKTLDNMLSIDDSLEDRILFGTDWPISSQSSYLDLFDTFMQKYKHKFVENNLKLINTIFKTR